MYTSGKMFYYTGKARRALRAHRRSPSGSKLLINFLYFKLLVGSRMPSMEHSIVIFIHPSLHNKTACQAGEKRRIVVPILP